MCEVVNLANPIHLLFHKPAKYEQINNKAVVAEWLRRLTRNQIPSGSVGSNPTDCEVFCSFLIPNINMSLSNVKIVKLHSNLCASNVGSVVECSPATWAARVRFPDVAAITFFNPTSAFYFPTHKQIFYPVENIKMSSENFGWRCGVSIPVPLAC